MILAHITWRHSTCLQPWSPCASPAPRRRSPAPYIRALSRQGAGSILGTQSWPGAPAVLAGMRARQSRSGRGCAPWAPGAEPAKGFCRASRAGSGRAGHWAALPALIAVPQPGLAGQGSMRPQRCGRMRMDTGPFCGAWCLRRCPYARRPCRGTALHLPAMHSRHPAQHCCKPIHGFFAYVSH